MSTPRTHTLELSKPHYGDRLGPTRPSIQPFITTTTTAVARKKGTGIRAWLLLYANGRAQVVEAGKHAIMRRTGLPARDLRILDPLLSYPSTVLGRGRAIVINLEHIKVIITAHEVLLLNSNDPSVTPFVEELQRRLARHDRAAIKAQEGNGDDSKNPLGGFAQLESQEEEGGGEEGGGGELESQEEGGGKGNTKQDLESRDGMKIPPFEFVALEACLEAACNRLESEVRTLELEAHPALDKLTSQISTLNLERVRHIKSRLADITGRVQKVRDELEHLLDDDEDMAEMYLTYKLGLENSSASSINEGDVINNDIHPELEDRVAPEISLLESHHPSHSHEGDLPKIAIFGRDGHDIHTNTTRSAISKQLNVEELEMLLEAYFVQIDGTLNKLSTLREYVDDTEDYINIMLDDKQNHLLQMGVVLSTATLVLSAFVCLVGILGMNIHIELFDNTGKKAHRKYFWTAGGGTAGTLFLFIVAIAWYKHKGLL